MHTVAVKELREDLVRKPWSSPFLLSFISMLSLGVPVLDLIKQMNRLTQRKAGSFLESLLTKQTSFSKFIYLCLGMWLNTFCSSARIAENLCTKTDLSPESFLAGRGCEGLAWQCTEKKPGCCLTRVLQFDAFVKTFVTECQQCLAVMRDVWT